MTRSDYSLTKLNNRDLQRIYAAARLFAEKLENKDISFIYQNNGKIVEKTCSFKTKYFAHLVGLNPKNKRGANYLFKRCQQGNLKPSMCTLTHEPDIIHSKLDVINLLMDVDTHPKEIGLLKKDALKNNFAVSVGKNGIISFKLANNGELVPNSSLNDNFKKETFPESRRQVLCTIKTPSYLPKQPESVLSRLLDVKIPYLATLKLNEDEQAIKQLFDYMKTNVMPLPETPKFLSNEKALMHLSRLIGLAQDWNFHLLAEANFTQTVLEDRSGVEAVAWIAWQEFVKHNDFESLSATNAASIYTLIHHYKTMFSAISKEKMPTSFFPHHNKDFQNLLDAAFSPCYSEGKLFDWKEIVSIQESVPLFTLSDTEIKKIIAIRKIEKRNPFENLNFRTCMDRIVPDDIKAFKGEFDNCLYFNIATNEFGIVQTNSSSPKFTPVSFNGTNQPSRLSDLLEICRYHKKAANISATDTPSASARSKIKAPVQNVAQTQNNTIVMDAEQVQEYDPREDFPNGFPDLSKVKFKNKTVNPHFAEHFLPKKANAAKEMKGARERTKKQVDTKKISRKTERSKTEKEHKK